MIKRRLYYLRPMHAELERVTRGKRFEIRNDIAWLMALDSHAVLIIELASWCKRQIDSGGLFGQLGARLNELPRKFPKSRKRRLDDPYLVRYDTTAHGDAVDRLFPNATSDGVQPRDVDQLRENFCAMMQPVIDDRNLLRAHPFEVVDGTATALALDDIERVFDKLERMLNDIRLVADWSTTSFNSMVHADEEQVAKAFVDTVLCGDSWRTEYVMNGVDRDAYYASLHELHDAGDAGALLKTHRLGDPDE